MGLIIYVCGRFSTPSFYGVGLPAYLSNRNQFSREHVFVGFNEFPSLVYWCCHPSSPATGAYSFSKSEIGFYVCTMLCVHRHGSSCFFRPLWLDGWMTVHQYTREGSSLKPTKMCSLENRLQLLKYAGRPTPKLIRIIE